MLGGPLCFCLLIVDQRGRAEGRGPGGGGAALHQGAGDALVRADHQGPLSERCKRCRRRCRRCRGHWLSLAVALVVVAIGVVGVLVIDGDNTRYFRSGDVVHLLNLIGYWR